MSGLSHTSDGLHVGIIGGGLGGLAAAIAIRRAGARVTVLEGAAELGEIGAGIQMFGNVSRFLVRTGVDEIIGDNLVAMEDVRNWATVDTDANECNEDVDVVTRHTGRLIGKLKTRDIVKMQGFPWWVVRRDHLHSGLAEGARRHGAELIVNARLKTLELQDGTGGGVEVVTQKGDKYHFDLVIGADGINSVTRKNILPDLVPHAASKIAAYRCVVPYKEVFEKIPEAQAILGNTMDLYSGHAGYVLLYPLSAGRELNIVTAFEQNHHVTTLEEASLEEFKAHYRSFPPLIQKVLDLVKETKRWPLLVVPPTKRWSNDQRNVVLMGDAAHGMQNHMAQGAATSMEDGIFLGRIISEVLRGSVSLSVGIQLYEEKRIPRCWTKQQSAFCMGEMWKSGGEQKRARDDSNSAEVRAFARNPVHPGRELEPTYRTTAMFMSPSTVPGILYYDAEGDADFAVCEWLQNHGRMDPETMVVDKLRDKWASAIWDNGVQRWSRSNRDAKL